MRIVVDNTETGSEERKVRVIGFVYDPEGDVEAVAPLKQRLDQVEWWPLKCGRGCRVDIHAE